MLDTTTLLAGGIPGVTVGIIALLLLFRFFFNGWWGGGN
jgi:hypothetical protein